MPSATKDPTIRDKQDEKTKEPSKYKVIFHNDDFTSMEFVVSVLVSIFRHSEVSAYEIMMSVHKTGKGVAGVFTREVAETKASQTIQLAKKNDFPLEVSIEPE